MQALTRSATLPFLLTAATWAQTVGSFPDVAVPAGNPLTADKVLLGKALFFEEQLSSDDTMACATCHLPEAGGSEVRVGARGHGRDEILGSEDDEFGSPGVVRQDRGAAYRRHRLFEVDRQVTERHAPTVYGAAFFEELFWDGSAGQVFRDLDGSVVLESLAALESQAVVPLLSAVEMAHENRSWAQVVDELARARPLALARELPAELASFVAEATYSELFSRAFGPGGISRERIAMALASYERVLVPDQTPFDLGTMTPEEELGFEVFARRGLCTTCHLVSNGLFSDGLKHSIDLPGHPRATKTPTLRNVGLQPALTSSGQFSSLEAVVAHYERVGFFLAPALKSEERRALLAFLGNALTDERVLRQLPPFDRPRLRSESEPFGSNLYGTAWPGTGGSMPELIASTPAYLGNADFKLGLGGGLGGAPAFLVLGPSRTRLGTMLRGVPLHVELRGALVFARTLSGALPGHGVATFRLPLPADPALLGQRRFAQGFVLDPNALGGLAATRGAEIAVFAQR